MTVAIATTWEQRLSDLGSIPANRILTRPAPGTATVADVVSIRCIFHALASVAT